MPGMIMSVTSKGIAPVNAPRTLTASSPDVAASSTRVTVGAQHFARQFAAGPPHPSTSRTVSDPERNAVGHRLHVLKRFFSDDLRKENAEGSAGADLRVEKIRRLLDQDYQASRWRRSKGADVLADKPMQVIGCTGRHD